MFHARSISIALMIPALIVSSALPAEAAQLVVPGSVWRYLDDGSDQGAAWRAPGFDDTTWSAGPAQLGYGDGDETTVVGFGPDSGAKFITTWFRHAFTVVDSGAHPVLNVGVVRDDGVVVYLNGTEIARSNMPNGAVGFTTPASTAIGGAAESEWTWFAVDPGLLVNGANVLAAEIHQSSGSSSDISFDLELNDNVPDNVVTRGPYLQQGTSSEIIVRWRTAILANSRVRFGAAPGSLTEAVDDPAVTTEHEVKLTGLSPNTTYYYSVGSTSATHAGNDADHFFITAPPVGAEQPVRIWVIGDSGTANSGARAVRDAYKAFTGSMYTDLWLMLGDNAYSSGTDAEYQVAVYDTYPELLRQSVLWPTRGNHETLTSVYYGMFSLPSGGEAGGLPSGSEAYYSFDYANIHFVCLDSEGSSTSAAMRTWLEADLASTLQRWIVAFWHHPPYTKGSHDSDNASASGGRMRNMREDILPILEAGGVDLTLTGHSHSYERSFLIGGHYGVSSTFDPLVHLFDGGDGREDGDGAYAKTVGPRLGAVYCVAGSSGQTSGGPLNHPVMASSLNVLGSVVIDVDGDRMDVRFLDNAGTVRDGFTLLTGDPIPPVLTSLSPSQGPVRGGTTVTLTGTNLSPGATVAFGGVDAGVVSRNGETEIAVTAPPGSSAGQAVDVTVSQGGLSDTLPGGFTYGENPNEIAFSGMPLEGGSLTITVYGASHRPVAVAVGRSGTTMRGGLTFCVEGPFPLFEHFRQGRNTGAIGRVDVPWNDLPGPAFMTWNITAALKDGPGQYTNVGCLSVTIFP